MRPKTNLSFEEKKKRLSALFKRFRRFNPICKDWLDEAQNLEKELVRECKEGKTHIRDQNKNWGFPVRFCRTCQVIQVQRISDTGDFAGWGSMIEVWNSRRSQDDLGNCAYYTLPSMLKKLFQ